jgi:hypothetical protein
MKIILLTILLLFVMGCNNVTLHPIEKTDIYRIKAGECNAEKDGWFISDLYLKEVMRAKVQ